MLPSEFKLYCLQFEQISAALADNWTLVKTEGGESVFLKKQDASPQRNLGTIVTPSEGKEEDCTLDDLSLNVTDLESEDLSELNDKISFHGVVTAEYEIHFSESYGVPVIYARFWDQLGQLLPLERAWKEVTPSEIRSMEKISFGPHPISGLPWIQIHPCKTDSILKEILETCPHQNYLVAFLSLYGKAVGIELSPEYAIFIDK